MLRHLYKLLLLQRTVLSLFMVSAMFATIVTFRGEQYTFHSPKKVIVQHVHRQAPDGSFFNDTALAVGSVDSVPVQFLLQNQRIYGSKIDDDEEDEDITFRSTEALYVDAIKSGWEWLVCCAPQFRTYLCESPAYVKILPKIALQVAACNRLMW